MNTTRVRSKGFKCRLPRTESMPTRCSTSRQNFNLAKWVSIVNLGARTGLKHRAYNTKQRKPRQHETEKTTTTRDRENDDKRETTREREERRGEKRGERRQGRGQMMKIVHHKKKHTKKRRSIGKNAFYTLKIQKLLRFPQKTGLIVKRPFPFKKFVKKNGHFGSD